MVRARLPGDCALTPMLPVASAPAATANTIQRNTLRRSRVDMEPPVVRFLEFRRCQILVRGGQGAKSSCQKLLPKGSCQERLNTKFTKNTKADHVNALVNELL